MSNTLSIAASWGHSMSPYLFIGRRPRGFTLIEVVMVIVITGILATIAVRQMSGTIQSARYEQTLRELNALAFAIAGNPDLHVGGVRTDYGYVGDVGALPPNLEALRSNPSGLATWAGPYMGTGVNADDFKTDGWGVVYSYTDTLIRSIGSGSNLDKIFARTSAALLSNQVTGFVRDARQSSPGSGYADSLLVRLTYPDGSGNLASAAVNPAPDGSFAFTGIPIGVHDLQIVFIPENDTISMSVGVDPGSVVRVDVAFPAALF
ncbi:MAG: prepilin-type N-terminal cleavage/methylation domain-containing protein [bacterium]